jgi:hypothetical protein
MMDDRARSAPAVLGAFAALLATVVLTRSAAPGTVPPDV